mgnify:CR=1 FL=1
MKKIHETTPFSVSGDYVWEVISNVSRCDWLPTVNHVDLDGDIRSFEMEGMGPFLLLFMSGCNNRVEMDNN